MLVALLKDKPPPPSDPTSSAASSDRRLHRLRSRLLRRLRLCLNGSPTPSPPPPPPPRSSGNFSYTEKLTVKYAGAAAMYMVSKKLKKKYNITDERAALYEAAETWTKALEGRDFLGGSKPNLADLAVFGVLRPIRYLKSGRDMVENTGIGEWYQRMETAVGEPSRVQA